MKRYLISLVKQNNGTLLLLLALLMGPLPAKASFLETSNYKALFELQPFKAEITADYEGHSFVNASLINLNTHINSAYILNLRDKKAVDTTYNLLTISDRLQLRLDNTKPELVISDHQQDLYACNIEDEITEAFKRRSQPKLGYLPTCKDLLFIVVKQDGNQPTIEKGAEVVRWLAGDSGEDLINGVKENFFADNYLVEEQAQESPDPAQAPDTSNLPPKASIQAQYEKFSIPTNLLGLKTEGAENTLLAGRWYPLKNFPGFFASMIEPRMVAEEILGSYRDRVNPLDGVENKAAVYVMAFSLTQYTIGWGHGTDHPGVGWSERAVNIKKDNPLGPDGFNSIKPIIPLGHTPPSLWPNTVGTFSGGFQKRHGAFRYGELSTKEKAHHYGFMENGVLLATPSEDLATFIMLKDGGVEMKTWTEQDQGRLHLMRHIRQNGLPIIDRNELGQGVPGQFVKFWGPGNWSGSADKELRTPRGAACIIEGPQDRYLVYAYFSGATPSGLARVFQAYGCNYAIQLDMNSPGQAYASLFQKRDNSAAFDIEHLMTAMTSGDTAGAPRYFIKPDYKDFFYITKKP